jgi:hypothetical protein
MYRAATTKEVFRDLPVYFGLPVCPAREVAVVWSVRKVAAGKT